MSAALESLFGIAFRDPELLLLALLIPVPLLWRRRAGLPALDFAPAMLLPVSGPRPALREHLATAATVLGLLAGVLALARPVEVQALPAETVGVDVMLCIDLSSSMATRDPGATETRLAAARAAAAAFVRARDDDRIGLLGFARFGDLVCPLTRDRRALLAFLEGLELVEREGAEDATGIGAGLARAAEALRRGTSRSRVAILLTDGEENVATAETPGEIAPVHAAQLCEGLGIRVHTIAFGSGPERGAGGRGPVDATQLRIVAEKTGGRFFAARDAGALAAVYAEIDALEKAPLSERRYELIDRHLGLIFAAAALLALGRLLGSGPLGALP